MMKQKTPLEKLISERLKKLEGLKKVGIEPFGYRFERTHRIKDIIDKFSTIKTGEKLENKKVKIAVCGKYTQLPDAYKSITDPDEHLALVMGDILTDEPVLARVHSECVTGDVFGSLRCDCGEQVNMALQMIAESPSRKLPTTRAPATGFSLNVS